MKSPFGLRLYFLMGALLCVGGGTIFGLLFASKRLREVEASVNASQLQRSQIAIEARRELQNLNTAMLNYALVRNPEQWVQFERAGKAFDSWIDEHDPDVNPRSELTTDSERRLIKALDHAFDDYLASARVVHSNPAPPMLTPHQLAEINAFNVQADRMRDFVRQLVDAHRKAEEAALASATGSLESLRRVLVAAVVLLLSLVGAMGWVIYRDMIAPLRTKLVESQYLLERQAKLATLGTLAAGIAHEIRNPLTSLKARLYTLERHLEAVPAARKDTEILSREITRLEHIVRDVLSFARPADPKFDLVDADTLLREVHGLMSPGLEGRGIVLVVESKPGLVLRVDTGHMKQVLINLVRNAGEAIDGAGRITLRSRSEMVDREANVVVLEVADTGRGIPPHVEKQLFDPFFSTKETGTGLGLPIAARIVERHGGSLRYKTQPGVGTTFGVVLPRERGKGPADAPPGGGLAASRSVPT
jgi:signal transduction histidine kinase